MKDNNIEYINTITVDDYNALRTSVGWGEVNAEQAQASLNGSTLVIAAKADDKTVGTGRLIWDSGNSALIKDILVLPDYQGCGIGTEIMERILTYLKERIKPGWGVSIDLMSAIGKEKFYEKFGFVIRPRDRRGSGMDMWLTKE